MSHFDHEKLDVYRLSLEFVGWVDQTIGSIEVQHRVIRDQLTRAAQSIPLNIAEGNGKRSGKDRRRFFEIARGSAMECAASLDVLVAVKAQSDSGVAAGKAKLIRIVSMLTKLAPPAGDGAEP